MHSIAFFQPLEPRVLENGFAPWVTSIAGLMAGKVVAIDGKASKGFRKAGAMVASCI
jgi:hypothetical protein